MRKEKRLLKKRLRELEAKLDQAKKDGKSYQIVVSIRKNIMRTVNLLSHINSFQAPKPIPIFIAEYGVRKHVRRK